MAEIAFRFDIDSHKCIREGVPILLRISDECGAPFSFYVNAGKAVSISDTLKSMMNKRQAGQVKDIKMLSAKEKLGTADYIFAAIVNPPMTQYADNLRAIWNSSCEMGLHGGMNHSHWYMDADRWEIKKIKADIEKAISNMQKVIPEFRPLGFAAPGFVTTPEIESLLSKIGFRYTTDFHSDGKKEIVLNNNGFRSICVNMCGEPGGVAYFEHAQAAGISDDAVVDDFVNRADKYDKLLVFDHPYFAAVQKADLLERIIKELIRCGHHIVTVKELCGIED